MQQLSKSIRGILVVSAFLAVTPAKAQHGGGPPAGVGGGNGGGMGSEMRSGGGFPANGSGRDGSNGAFDNPNRPVLSTHSSTTTLNNARLATSLSAALTRSGITVPAGGLGSACSGFHNLGQCVAALHVAQNLNLPGGFTALKGLTAGNNTVSLGKAIQQLSPTADARLQERKAKRQARADLDTLDTPDN